MSTFNKLYHLILLSIITEDINSKIKKAIDTLIQSGLLKDENDPRIEQLKTIIKRNNSIDINSKTKLNLLLKANLTLLNRAESKKDNYLDNIPEFSLKRLYPNGVVIYKVLDSKAGMNAVRRIVDAQWGKEANPWCIITRNKLGNLEGAWSYWTHYNRFPKQIAFQNGKLVAFRASRTSVDYWWNRLDLKNSRLKPLEGKTINVPPALWTEEELKLRKNDQIAAFKLQFKYNLLTKRWDTKDKDVHIRIEDLLLVNGDLPFPMGTIYGNIGILDCKELRSLNNGPTKVTGNIYFDRKNKSLVENSQMYKNYQEQLSLRFIERFHLIYNENTKRYDANKNVWVLWENIKDNQLPVPFGVINGNFNCLECNNLKYTNYLPTKVTGTLDIVREGTRAGNMIRKSLFYKNYVKLTPLRFINNFNLVYNEKTKMYDFIGEKIMIEPWDLIGWDHIPVKLGVIKGDCIIERIRDLKSLLNCPEIVKGNFNVMYNGQLGDLRGFPKHVTGRVQLNDLFVRELDGMLNSTIDGNFDIRGLAYLESLENFPKLNGNLLITSWQYKDKNIKDYIDEHHIKCGND